MRNKTSFCSYVLHAIDLTTGSKKDGKSGALRFGSILVHARDVQKHFTSLQQDEAWFRLKRRMCAQRPILGILKSPERYSLPALKQRLPGNV